MHTGMFCVSAVLQHDAPVPQSWFPGVHARYEMQIPAPLGSRSTSQDFPTERHSPPPFVHGLPMPRQLPAVVGHVVP
jgi:hypothetical protein